MASGNHLCSTSSLISSSRFARTLHELLSCIHHCITMRIVHIHSAYLISILFSVLIHFKLLTYIETALVIGRAGIDPNYCALNHILFLQGLLHLYVHIALLFGWYTVMSMYCRDSLFIQDLRAPGRHLSRERWPNRQQCVTRANVRRALFSSKSTRTRSSPSSSLRF